MLARSVILILAIFLTACQEKQANKTSELTKHIGWLHNNCLAIKNNGLKSDEQVVIVSFEKVQHIYNARIDKKADSNSKCPQLLEDIQAINITEGYSFYLIKQEIRKLDLEIGLIGIKPKLEKTSSQVTVDIDSDGTPDYFTQCSSSEGIHFSIWSGTPYQGKPIWTGYYYLGSELSPRIF